MRCFLTKWVVIVAAAAALVIGSATARAATFAPLPAKAIEAAATDGAAVTKVQYYGHRRYSGPRRYHRDRRYRDNTGAAAVGAIFGMALGAIIASQGQRQSEVGYCLRRYRSYDPRSGTYLGYDGRRHPCP